MNKVKFLQHPVAFIVPLVIASAALGYAIGSDGGDGGDAHIEQAVSEPGVETFWTCSMHPQIHQDGPGQCPICGMDLIPVTVGGAAESASPRQLHLSPAAEKLAEIRTEPVVSRTVSYDVSAVGKVAYDETRVQYITSWIPGRIDRLYVDYTGIPVSKGAPLAEIYSPELYAAQREYLEALRTSERLSAASLSGFRETAGLTAAASREKLRLLGMTEAQLDRLRERGEPSEHVAIYSGIDGVVIGKNATAGMYVTTGSPIYNVADLSHLWVFLDVYESDLQWVREGQDVTFTSEAYPGETFTGEVAFISPIVDPQTRTIDVRVNVPNPDGRLKPDMLVDAVIHAPMDAVSEESPVVIPRTAPLITGKRAVVYVAVPDQPGTYEGREVTLGPRAGDYYLVASGLAEGEEVVVNGGFKIDSALQIQAKPSMMNPEGGVTQAVHDHGAIAGSSGDSGMLELAQMDAGHEGHDMPETDDTDGMSDMGGMTGDGMNGEVKTYDVPDAFLAQLEGVYKAYFEIKTALSSDSREEAATASERLTAALKEVDMTLLGHEAHMAWMAELAVLSEHGEAIANSSDIAGARDAFYPLSESLIRIAGMFGHSGENSIYRFHCPMANQGKGADWLQNTPELRNPYYGASMLTCGSLVEEYSGVREQ